MDPFIDDSELKDIVSIIDKINVRPITEETKAEASVVCSHLILAYTVRLRYNECDRIGTKWLFLFFLPSLRKCCVVIEKNVDKKAYKQN